MDVTQITDLNQLKAMVYDEIVAKERAETNIKIINGRIQQVISNPPQIPIPKEPKGEKNGHKPNKETSEES